MLITGDYQNRTEPQRVIRSILSWHNQNPKTPLPPTQVINNDRLLYLGKVAKKCHIISKVFCLFVPFFKNLPVNKVRHYSFSLKPLLTATKSNVICICTCFLCFVSCFFPRWKTETCFMTVGQTSIEHVRNQENAN